MTTTCDRGVPSAPVGDHCGGVQEFKSHSFRQRGLFPLPCDGSMERTRGGLSRGCQQGAGRRRELRKCVSEMTCALKFTLRGGGFPSCAAGEPCSGRSSTCFALCCGSLHTSCYSCFTAGSPSGASAFFRRVWRWHQHCTLPC